MKNQINGIFDVLINQKNTSESSRLFDCNRIDYIADKERDFFDHHLMIYRNNELLFKVWLRNDPKDKPYKDILEAMNDVGMEIYMFKKFENKTAFLAAKKKKGEDAIAEFIKMDREDLLSEGERRIVEAVRYSDAKNRNKFRRIFPKIVKAVEEEK